MKLDVINNVPYLPKGPVMFGAPNLDACPAMPAMPGPVLALNDELYPAAPSEADAPDEGGEIIEIKHPEGYRTEAQLRAEAKTLQHMMTHLPKNPFCTHCQRAKMENVRLHRRGGADAHECTKFGDIVTVDTMVLHGLKDRGVNGEADAVVFYDLATKYIDVLPVFSRSVPNTVEAFHKFMGPEPKIGLLYSDQAREFLAATRRMAWVHHMSTPGMPKTNGIIENKVKLVLHGARVLLKQAGLSPKRWPFAVRAFCAARNLENRGEGTAWGRRSDDRDFPGQLIPFGCLVDFKPIAPTPRRLEKGGFKNASERDDHHKADEIPTKHHWTNTAMCQPCRRRKLTLLPRRPNSGQCRNLEFS